MTRSRNHYMAVCHVRMGGLLGLDRRLEINAWNSIILDSCGFRSAEWENTYLVRRVGAARSVLIA